MCCLFTWLAWCFDASHRVVVFIMSCLISSSICCLLLIASMAGVAMGYNYSLAEYIDLKETNISVYIKRGVYDDEIADDFDWRRSGKDLDVVTMNSPQLNQQPLAARRHLKSSAFEGDDENKYEGSLMRLTSPPSSRPLYQPEPPYTTSSQTTNRVDRMLAIADKLPAGSVDRLRAIQAAARYHENSKVELASAKFPDDASARMKAIEANAQIHDSRRHDQVTTTDKYSKYFNQLARYPPMPGSDLAARRFQEQQEKDMDIPSPDRFRDVVFKGHLAGMRTGPTTKRTTANFFEYDSNTEPPDSRKHMSWDVTRKPQSAEDSKSIRDETQSREEEDAHGLPTRKKRCNDNGLKKKLDVTTTIDVKTYDDRYTTAVTSSEYSSNGVFDKVFDYHEKVKNESEDRDQRSEPTDIKNNSHSYNETEVKVTDVHMDNQDANINEMSTEVSIKTSDKSILIEKVNNTKELNAKISFNELFKNYFSYLTNGQMENKESAIRKRWRKFDGAEYQSREGKDVRTVWWRISNGIHELSNKIVSFIDRRIFPV